jgi:hypothetical protein
MFLKWHFLITHPDNTKAKRERGPESGMMRTACEDVGTLISSYLARATFERLWVACSIFLMPIAASQGVNRGVLEKNT